MAESTTSTRPALQTMAACVAAMGLAAGLVDDFLAEFGEDLGLAVAAG